MAGVQKLAEAPPRFKASLDLQSELRRRPNPIFGVRRKLAICCASNWMHRAQLELPGWVDTQVAGVGVTGYGDVSRPRKS